MPKAIWVAELRISNRTAQKIVGRHNVEPHEVREAVVCVSGLTAAWDDHPDKGLRALVQVRIRDRRWLAVLYPVEHPMGGVWNLGSIFEEPA